MGAAMLAFALLVYLGCRRSHFGLVAAVILVATAIGTASTSGTVVNHIQVGLIAKDALPWILLEAAAGGLLIGISGYCLGRIANWLYRRISRADKNQERASAEQAQVR
jgi:hypothetical protein